MQKVKYDKTNPFERHPEPASLVPSEAGVEGYGRFSASKRKKKMLNITKRTHFDRHTERSRSMKNGKMDSSLRWKGKKSGYATHEIYSVPQISVSLYIRIL